MVPNIASTGTSDDYFQTIVINSLLNILKDQSLAQAHHGVIEAIMSIFKTQGLKCVTFLPQVSCKGVVLMRPLSTNDRAARSFPLSLQ